MKNKHRIKQGLSLLLAGGIALTNLGGSAARFCGRCRSNPRNCADGNP